MGIPWEAGHVGTGEEHNVGLGGEGGTTTNAVTTYSNRRHMYS